MSWWMFLIILFGLVVVLGGCGTGRPGRVVGSVPFVAASAGASETQTLPAVMVTVKTDYPFAQTLIRFEQIDGDEDFAPPITVINQGLRFQFLLPKGYRYQLWFADIPSIDEPAPYIVDLRDFSGDFLELPLFQFVYHP